MNAFLTDFARAAGRTKKANFNESFDWLLTRINFKSEEEAILPENIEETKEAIREFLTDMGWFQSRLAFEELLQEKSGKEAYRADGRVPNFYHEVREFLYLCAKRRDGLLAPHCLDEFGGFDALTAVVWRHDSWEDHGIHPTAIYALHERHIHEFMNEVDPNHTNPDVATFGYRERQKAEIIARNIDYVTHKHPERDENGEFKRKPSGKLVKVPRYPDMTLYYDNASLSPHFPLLKFEDSVEGMATRYGVTTFSHASNVDYTLERRQFYGGRALDKEAIAKFSFLDKAIKSSDGMLGNLLLCNEQINFYHGKDPHYIRPVSLPDRYFPHAERGYRLLPAAWHPVTIMLERLENMAEMEAENGQVHTRLILDKSLYPSLSPHFPIPHNYAGPLLSGQPQYAPNGP